MHIELYTVKVKVSQQHSTGLEGMERASVLNASKAGANGVYPDAPERAQQRLAG